MGKALYRTYRSKSLAEIVGQEHITSSLSRALKNGTIAHAYLFTGPKGVGKTSIARILAHEINNLPYEGESTSLDIIEIDAASNRRIDEIRDLRDKVHTAPASAKYKVYIIDEVHMLTREAFNALLKTLEEPPAHVVFVLATTEVHKLPETIISRTQRFAFKPVEQAKVVNHLKSIAKQEKIEIADDALELIAAHGEGSFRDSISLLDQIRNSDKKITLKTVQAALGIAPAEIIDTIINSLSSHNVPELAGQLQSMQLQGLEPAQTAKQLAKKLRDGLVSGKSMLDKNSAIRLLAQLIEVPSSSNPQSYLEIALLDAALAGQSQTNARHAGSSNKNQANMAEKVTSPETLTEQHPSTFSKKTKKPDKKPTANSALLDDTAWEQVLNIIKKKRSTLHSILKPGLATFSPGKVTIKTANSFSQKRLNEPKNLQAVAETIQEVCGQSVELTCILDKNAKPQTKSPEKADATDQDGALGAISNIFGGAEVLDS